MGLQFHPEVTPGIWRDWAKDDPAALTRHVTDPTACQGSREFPGCDHGFSPPVIAGRRALMASRWARIR
jgi:hypothetical protein